MKNWIDKMILKQSKKRDWIVHGGQTLNKQLPKHLYRKTEDWDLWSKQPRQESVYLESILERKDPGDQFDNTKMKLGSTDRYVYSVVERSTNKIIADFTITPTHKNLYILIGGVRYETLAHAKRRYKQILEDPALRKRHVKTLGDIQRIEQFEYETSHKGVVEKNTLHNLLLTNKFILKRKGIVHG